MPQAQLPCEFGDRRGFGLGFGAQPMIDGGGDELRAARAPILPALGEQHERRRIRAAGNGEDHPAEILEIGKKRRKLAVADYGVFSTWYIQHLARRCS